MCFYLLQIKIIYWKVTIMQFFVLFRYTLRIKNLQINFFMSNSNISLPKFPHTSYCTKIDACLLHDIKTFYFHLI